MAKKLSADDLDLEEFKLQIDTAMAELRELKIAVDKEQKFVQFSTWEVVKLKVSGIAKLYKKRVAVNV